MTAIAVASVGLCLVFAALMVLWGPWICVLVGGALLTLVGLTAMNIDSKQ